MDNKHFRRVIAINNLVDRLPVSIILCSLMYPLGLLLIAIGFPVEIGYWMVGGFVGSFGYDLFKFCLEWPW